MAVAGQPARYVGRILCNPLEVLTCGWRERRLIQRLATREIETRYRGSILGLTWSLIVPLLLLAVYTFVFSVIFGLRWDVPVEGRGVFAIVLFTGLILFNVFAECVNRAPGLMIERVAYIKKVVFPLEIIAWVTLLVALFNAAVSSVALLVGYLVFVGIPPLTAIAAPFALLPLILLTLGLTWFLSSVGVYLRDFQQFVPVLVMIVMYLNPVFYPLEVLLNRVGKVPPPVPAAEAPADTAAGIEHAVVPEPPTPSRLARIVHIVYKLSPFAVAIEEARGALFKGVWPSWRALLFHTGLAWGVAWLGFMWFNKTRKGFADVL